MFVKTGYPDIISNVPMQSKQSFAWEHCLFCVLTLLVIDSQLL
ncbi:hypothetical protein BACCELL_01081 [Bacteroides cellulosilyticus DSM 14838]|uniref:Uncharacterized protein n=1 Tax=Bacteroides cellulosilyticus DSM 14838 TaxID=537012 RepID=E2N9Y3_9BACE|nr:hypothetical protein BACCELL_01081 [Bacteroides cellulosilyticus DSM 14838]